MDDILKKLKERVKQQLKIDVTVVIGGSEIIGEASKFSDRDVYIITKNIFGLVRLLRQKDEIKQIKKELHIADDILFMSRDVMALKLFYVHGEDTDGNLISTDVDFHNVAATSMKIAYRDLGRAIQEKNSGRKKYYLGRCALHTTILQVIAEGKKWQQPYFGVAEAVSVTEDERMKNIVYWKMAQDDRDVIYEDVAYVKDMLDNVWQIYKTKRVPWRTWLVRSIFAIKQRQWKKLKLNYDKKVVERLRNMIEKNDFQQWKTTCKDVVYLLYI